MRWPEPRIPVGRPRRIALVADPGQYDEKDAILRRMHLTGEQKAAFPGIDPSSRDDLAAYLQGPDAPPMLHWSFIQRGFWVHGVDSVFAYAVEFARYNLSPYVKNITAPTFITQAEDDPVAAHPPALYEAIDAPKVLEVFKRDDGAGMHCEMLARALYHQKLFAWLDRTLGHERARGNEHAANHH